MERSPLLKLIGNTPLVELRSISPKPGVHIYAKLEGQNPTGSIKDRVALALIEVAERKGHLKPGDTIIEASSGNTGIALAFVAKQRGYKAHIVLPRGVAPSIYDLLKMYGVEMTWCEVEGGMKRAIDAAKKLVAERGYKMLGQFTERANLEVHYKTTGPEILRDLPHVDIFIAGIGTSGTIMGVGKCLREANPKVRLIGIEPKLGERLQGLRSLDEGYIPPLLDLKALDGRFIVDSAAAFQCAKQVALTEGILAGASAGATLHIALKLAERIEKGNIVCMFADAGWKYLPARPWDVASHQEREAMDEIHWW